MEKYVTLLDRDVARYSARGADLSSPDFDSHTGVYPALITRLGWVAPVSGGMRVTREARARPRCAASTTIRQARTRKMSLWRFAKFS